MSTIKNPVGPQPSKVYWRRRLVVGLVLLAVILIAVLIFTRPGSTESTPQPASTSTEAPAAEGADDADAGAVPDAAADGTCNPDSIVVEGMTDASTYAADANPLLTLSVTNNSDAECTMSVGADVQEFIITSGEERIWSSKDCQEASEPLELPLASGEPLTSTTPVTWNRTRSDPENCDAENVPKVAAEGASYHLNVIVNGVESAESKQFVLN
jgi:hypothetical protein